jgi:hypothetical protein
MKTILALVFLLFITACESPPSSWKMGIMPRPLTGIRNFPSTESEYGKGFKDGCNSAWDVVAKGLLSDYHERKFDYKRMQKSGDYGTGWWDGYEQCTYIMDWDVV